MVRVGIPRALAYYQYYPGWRSFFRFLGAETVISPPTNMEVFVLGNSRAVAETCLPVKVFLGHAAFLRDKCDCLFIPAIRSLGGKAFHCSKSLGLPDMTRALLPECPPVIDPEIDLNEGRRGLHRLAADVASRLGSDKGLAGKAADLATGVTLAYRRKMREEALDPVHAIEEACGGPAGASPGPNPSPDLSIALIGHDYVLYDDYITHRLVSRLLGMGARVLIPEMVSQRVLEAAGARLVGAPHWSFEAAIIGAGEHYLEKGVDGLICAAVFGCGPDSMMVDMVRRRARELAIPFLHLSLDEHSSPGGLLTRLEAFVDMVKRRKRACV